jgi:hypothetical protein
VGVSQVTGDSEATAEGDARGAITARRAYGGGCGREGVERGRRMCGVFVIVVVLV